jgi:hypothetical protein
MVAQVKSFGLGAILGILLGATVLGAFASLLLVGAVVLGAGAGAAACRGRRGILRRSRPADERLRTRSPAPRARPGH